MTDLQESGRLVSATTAYGHSMLVDPTDLIGKRIIQKGIFDGVSLALLTAILQKVNARTVLDVGANIGNHSLAFSRFCVRVIAFEPGRRNFSLLQQNAGLNPHAAITALNFGLSSAESEAVLYLDKRNFGGASLSRATSADEQHVDEQYQEHVALCVADRWLAENRVDDIDIIKIDVEGHEIEVLEGMAETLSEQRPIIFMEWNSPAVREQFLARGLFEQLFADYRAYAIEHNLSKQYWRAQPAGKLRRRLRCWFGRKRAFLTAFDAALTYSNIILVPREKSEALATLPSRPTFF